MDALLVVHLRVEARAEPADRERPERVEGHVAEVEQTGEAYHDVQTERHDGVGERARGVVDEGAALREEERKQHEDHERRHADPALDVLGKRVPRVADRAEELAELVHPASRVSSPSRPWGLKTMIRIR